MPSPLELGMAFGRACAEASSEALVIGANAIAKERSQVFVLRMTEPCSNRCALRPDREVG
jgi:hypothetical protein